MRLQHVGIVRVDHRRLGSAGEQLPGVADEVLVEGILPAHQHRQRQATGASRPPGLLPERGDGARVSVDDGGVQAPHVDAELHGIGRGDRQQLAGEEPPFDVATLLRQIARPVGRDPFGEVPSQPLRRPAVDQLGRLAAAREHDRVELAADQIRQQVGALGHGAAAPPQPGFLQRRVPQRDQLLSRR